MKSRLLLMAAAVALGFVVSNSINADESGKKAEFKATCPMSGGPAKEASFVMHKGKKVFFCCNNCPKNFEKDPSAVSAKVHYQFAETGQMIQVACPFTGRKVNPDATVELGSAKVSFCCNNCKGKFDKTADEEKLALVFGDISKGFTLQTECPVSGKAIKVDQSVEHQGKKVYFCCGNCPKAFEKEPAKFLSKLPQFAEEKK